MFRVFTFAMLAPLFASFALAQSINIDWGDLFGTPDSSYSAAGEAGVWNALDGSFGPHALVGLDGLPVEATVTFEPPTPSFGFDHPQTQGGNQALLDDAVGGFADVLGTVTFSALQPGMYRIHTYAWIPHAPENRIWVWLDDSPVPEVVGGAWVGPGPVRGVTHASHEMLIDPGTVRVNLVAGRWTHDWWLNGIQVVQLSEVLGDLNCDGVVDAFDIDPFVLAVVNVPEYYRQYPDCDHMHADIDGDGNVDAFDIDPFVELLTGG